MAAGLQTKTAKARKRYELRVAQDAVMAIRHARALAKAAPRRIAAARALLSRAGRGAGAEAEYHAIERLLHEKAFYPPHDKRKESAAYRKSHDDLVVKKGLPCRVCGVTRKTLGDPSKNPFGAVQMETHHHVIEWALANAIDPARFNQKVLPDLIALNRQKYEPYQAKGMTKEQIVAWVDHDEDNLWVLCDVHHRHVYVGIHAITFPIWSPQDIVDDVILQNQISLAKGNKSSVSGTERKKTGQRKAPGEKTPRKISRGRKAPARKTRRRRPR